MRRYAPTLLDLNSGIALLVQEILTHWIDSDWSYSFCILFWRKFSKDCDRFNFTYDFILPSEYWTRIVKTQPQKTRFISSEKRYEGVSSTWTYLSNSFDHCPVNVYYCDLYWRNVVLKPASPFRINSLSWEKSHFNFNPSKCSLCSVKSG